MPDNILESYLVRLGASVDTGSFSKFQSTLNMATTSVASMTTGVVKDFAKLEGAIVGTFTSVGLGIISLADKTAMADQQYRLFGLRMLMGKDAARAMQLATDNLGASLDQIAYDPELNARFRDLYERNVKLSQSLGKGFDDNMRSIRGIRTEAKQFGTELTFLSMGAVSKLFEKLGFGSGDLLRDVRNLNMEFSDNLPAWIDKVSNFLVPVWKDFTVILKDTGDLFKMAAGDFTYLTGILTGDQSLQNTNFDINNLAKATLDWVDGLTKLSLTFGLVARIGSHAFLSVADAAAAAYHASVGMATSNPKEIALGKELINRAADESVGVAADIRDIGNPANWANNKDFSGMVAYNTAHNFDPVTGKTTAPAGEQQSRIGNLMSFLRSDDSMKSLAASVSQKTGIPASLIYAQWAHETGGFTSNVYKKLDNAAGIRLPGSNDYKSYASMQDFADDYSKVITQGRYTSRGILGAKTPEDFAAALKSGGYYEDTQENYTAGLKRYAGLYDQGGPGASGAAPISIGTVNVTLPAGTPTEHMEMLTQKFRDMQHARTQAQIAQNGAGAYATAGVHP